MKHVLVALMVVGAGFLLWPHSPKQDPASTAKPEAGCSLTDPVHAIGRLVGNAQDCIAELRGSAPVGLGAGKSAYIRFDGNTWTQTGQALQNPNVKENGAKVYSYGSVSLTINLHDATGKNLYSAQATRGNAALLQLDYLDGQGANAVTIEDSERGTFEVILQ